MGVEDFPTIPDSNVEKYTQEDLDAIMDEIKEIESNPDISGDNDEEYNKRVKEIAEEIKAIIGEKNVENIDIEALKSKQREMEELLGDKLVKLANSEHS